MRVSIVIDSGTAGGAEGQAVSLTRALRDAGTDVDLLTLGPGDAYAAVIAEHRVPVSSLSSGPRLLAARAYFRRRRPDVVHVVKAPGLIGRASAVVAGVPTVLGGRRGFARFSRRTGALDALLRGSTAGWVVNSRRLRDYMVERERVAADRVHVIPNVVFLDDWVSPLDRAEARRRFGLPEDRTVAVHVASVRPVKNHDMALRAVARVDPAANVLVVFAGARTDAAAFRDRVAALGVSDRVVCLGHVDDVPTLLRAADVSLLTSDTEGMPNALLEAGAQSVPSITTDCGGATEIVTHDDTGLVVPVNDDEALAAAIVALSADVGRRERLGAAVRRHVEAVHDAPAVAERARSVYEAARVTRT